MAVGESGNGAASRGTAHETRHRYSVHSPEEFVIDMLKGLFANGYIVYTDAPITGPPAQLEIDSCGSGGQYNLSLSMGHVKEVEPGFVLVPVDFIRDDTVTTERIPLKLSDMPNVAQFKSIMQQRHQSSPKGPLEEILSALNFFADSKLPHVYQDSSHPIYFVARYKEEGDEKVPDVYIKYFEVNDSSKSDIQIGMPLGLGLKTRLNFTGKDTDAVYDVVDALLGKGYKVALPTSNIGLDKFLTLVPMPDEAISAEEFEKDLLA